MLNFLQRIFAQPSRVLTCASLAVALSACGGGGGSPGKVPGQPDIGVTPATIVLSTSADTMTGSGADGTEVVLTATVKDAGNNAMAGVTVAFQASSGTVSNTVRITDATGTVTEKLSTKGDPSGRDITLTASAGTKVSNSKVVKVIPFVPVTPKLLLTASSGNLASGGAAGTEVKISALVIDSKNVVVPNAIVNFTTDSGALDFSQRLTNSLGVATVNLGTGTDPTTRTITVTASVIGTPDATVKVNVMGTKITINSSPTVNVGAVSDMTVVLTDSLNNPLANKPITFSLGDPTKNLLKTKAGGGSPAMTDSGGKLILSFTAQTAGSAAINVSAMGETASASIIVVSSNFSVAAVSSLGAPVSQVFTTDCTKVAISNFVGATPQGGTVSLSTSRGTMYSDSGCTVPLLTGVPLTAGLGTAYVKASSPGVATLSATSSATLSTVQNTVEFVVPLTATSVISLQGTPSTVGVNAAGSTTQQVVLRAVVSDKATQGNPVKNAKVAFTIVNDSSGGSLSQPSEVLTGSDGSASISYIAGTTTTSLDGVQIRASVQSPINFATKDTFLTVAQQSLFISAGTGNTILIPNDTTYQVDYAVFVTDAAGNAVRDVTITGAVRPRNYRKGIMELKSADGPWIPNVYISCPNEDLDSDGVLSAGEDTNGNGRLDPVIPMNISSSGKTDATGTAKISMLYPKDRAYWIDIDFTIRGAVTGTEARYVGYTVLVGAIADFKDPRVPPPGAVSPYGTGDKCTDTL
jgi:hypothetical protein